MVLKPFPGSMHDPPKQVTKNKTNAATVTQVVLSGGQIKVNILTPKGLQARIMSETIFM